MFQAQIEPLSPRCVVLFVECCRSCGYWQLLQHICFPLFWNDFLDLEVILVKTIVFASFYFSISFLIPNINNICSTNGEDVPKLGCLELLFPIVILPIYSLCHKLYCPIKPYSIHLQWVKLKITCKRLNQIYNHYCHYYQAIRIYHSLFKTFSVFSTRKQIMEFSLHTYWQTIVQTSKNSE